MLSILNAFRDRRARRPHLSVVVVSFNMRRELPRTLHSLSARYQTNINRNEYEIILVDNGSDVPWAPRDLAHIEAELKIINLAETARPSPAFAVNVGLKEARGQLIGVMIDGARIVTPGMLDACRRAAGLYPRPVIAVLGFHLGMEKQSISVQKGYTQAVEDRLLDSIGWPQDGCRLFDISVLADSSGNGWLGPLTESNALFLQAELWEELGGYDEEFQSAGGGLVNLDTYGRALAQPKTQLVTILGEGCFHQVHGGISTNSPHSGPQNEWHDEYRRIRGRSFRQPSATPVLFGTLPPNALRHMGNTLRAAAQAL
ncbi:MAG: glycosyltransferase family A protein [Bryobacteraceae bacterium]|jgi:hypothetical protein